MLVIISHHKIHILIIISHNEIHMPVIISHIALIVSVRLVLKSRNGFPFFEYPLITLPTDTKILSLLPPGGPPSSKRSIFWPGRDLNVCCIYIKYSGYIITQVRMRCICFLYYLPIYVHGIFSRFFVMLREVFYYNENFNLKGFKESSVTVRKMPKIIFGINLIKPYDDVHPPPPPPPLGSKIRTRERRIYWI